jgi:threonine aldolase
VNVCFSKGLGAPVGSVLTGPAALMPKARRVRKMLGGGMRQAGILAAACLYALDNHLLRLADDHGRALRLWEGLQALGYTAERPETNMIYVTHPDAHALAAALGERGVRCIALAADQVRLVTHLEVDDAGVEWALGAFGEVR